MGTCVFKRARDWEKVRGKERREGLGSPEARQNSPSCFWGRERALCTLKRISKASYIYVYANVFVTSEQHGLVHISETFWLTRETFWLKRETFWLTRETFWLKRETFWLKRETFWLTRETLIWLKRETFWLTSETFWLKREAFWLTCETFWLTGSHSGYYTK